MCAYKIRTFRLINGDKYIHSDVFSILFAKKADGEKTQ